MVWMVALPEVIIQYSIKALPPWLQFDLLCFIPTRLSFESFERIYWNHAYIFDLPCHRLRTCPGEFIQILILLQWVLSVHRMVVSGIWFNLWYHKALSSRHSHWHWQTFHLHWCSYLCFIFGLLCKSRKWKMGLYSCQHRCRWPLNCITSIFGRSLCFVFRVAPVLDTPGH